MRSSLAEGMIHIPAAAGVHRSVEAGPASHRSPSVTEFRECILMSRGAVETPDLKSKSFARWTRAYVESSPDPLMVLDGSGGIGMVNAALEALLERDRSDLLGQPVQSVVPDLELDSLLAPRAGADLVIIARWGRLDAAAKARIDHPSLSDHFLAILSHELRTPLQAMLGWVQVLGSSRRDDRVVARGLSAIERNIQSQARVIDEVIEMSQIAAREFRLELRPLRASAVLEASLERIAEAAASRSIRLTHRFDPGEADVVADPRWLPRIATVLLMNALRFTSENGSIDLDLQREGDFMRITVTDASEGVAPGAGHRYDEFRDGPPSSAARIDALSIGLSNVHRLVEMHAGFAVADSQGFGRGASFVVRLPLAAGP